MATLCSPTAGRKPRAATLILERVRDREALLFPALLVANLLPLWAFRYIPTQDGPVHIAIANVLRLYHAPELSVLREIFTINTSLDPNLFVHLLLVGLMAFVPVLIAEKIVCSLYVILLPLSIRYAIGAIDARSRWLAVLSFPFVLGYAFHMGFYNFSWSVAAFFFVVGFWYRHREAHSPRDFLIFALLASWLYLCHGFSLAVACTTIGILAVAAAVREARDGLRTGCSLPALIGSLVRRHSVFPLLAFAPAIALSVLFMARNPARYLAAPRMPSRLKDLASAACITSFDHTEIVLSIAVVLVFAVLALLSLQTWLADRRLDRRASFAVVVGVHAALYLAIVPAGLFGGEFVYQRLNLYVFLLATLWFGTHTYSAVARRITCAVAAIISLSLVGLHMRSYSRLNGYLDEYLSGAPLVRANSTLLTWPVSGTTYQGRSICWRTSPFIHAGGYIAAQRGVAYLANFQAHTSHFPIRYRPELDPLLHLGAGGIPSYSARTGVRVDYVLVWGDLSDADAGLIRRQLVGNDLILTSSRGMMHLYRRKDFPDAR